MKVSFKVLREMVKWGTYGKSGKDRLKWVSVAEMDDEHIMNILRTQLHITSDFRRILIKELEYRGFLVESFKGNISINAFMKVTLL